MLLNLINIFAALWIVIILVTYLIPLAYGLPPTPTRPERIRRALQLAGLQPGEVLYDLGSGSGRVLLIAAREFGAQAVGIEAGPIQCIQAWAASLIQGVQSRVGVRWGNFFKADVRDADVVFAYLTSNYAKRLEAMLAAQLKPGARVVTISFDFPDWEPADFDAANLIFQYRMPPSPGNLESFLARKMG